MIRLVDAVVASLYKFCWPLIRSEWRMEVKKTNNDAELEMDASIIQYGYRYISSIRVNVITMFMVRREWWCGSSSCFHGDDPIWTQWQSYRDDAGVIVYYEFTSVFNGHYQSDSNKDWRMKWFFSSNVDCWHWVVTVNFGFTGASSERVPFYVMSDLVWSLRIGDHERIFI